MRAKPAASIGWKVSCRRSPSTAPLPTPHVDFLGNPPSTFFLCACSRTHHVGGGGAAEGADPGCRTGAAGARGVVKTSALGGVEGVAAKIGQLVHLRFGNNLGSMFRTYDLDASGDLTVVECMPWFAHAGIGSAPSRASWIEAFIAACDDSIDGTLPPQGDGILSATELENALDTLGMPKCSGFKGHQHWTSFAPQLDAAAEFDALDLRAGYAHFDEPDSCAVAPDSGLRFLPLNPEVDDECKLDREKNTITESTTCNQFSNWLEKAKTQGRDCPCVVAASNTQCFASGKLVKVSGGRLQGNPLIVSHWFASNVVVRLNAIAEAADVDINVVVGYHRDHSSWDSPDDSASQTHWTEKVNEPGNHASLTLDEATERMGDSIEFTLLSKDGTKACDFECWKRAKGAGPLEAFRKFYTLVFADNETDVNSHKPPNADDLTNLVERGESKTFGVPQIRSKHGGGDISLDFDLTCGSEKQTRFGFSPMCKHCDFAPDSSESVGTCKSRVRYIATVLETAYDNGCFELMDLNDATTHANHYDDGEGGQDVKRGALHWGKYPGLLCGVQKSGIVDESTGNAVPKKQFANEDDTERTLAESQAECLRLEGKCKAVACKAGDQNVCTVRASKIGDNSILTVAEDCWFHQAGEMVVSDSIDLRAKNEKLKETCGEADTECQKGKAKANVLQQGLQRMEAEFALHGAWDIVYSYVADLAEHECEKSANTCQKQHKTLKLKYEVLCPLKCNNYPDAMATIKPPGYPAGPILLDIVANVIRFTSPALLLDGYGLEVKLASDAVVVSTRTGTSVPDAFKASADSDSAMPPAEFEAWAQVEYDAHSRFINNIGIHAAPGKVFQTWGTCDKNTPLREYEAGKWTILIPGEGSDGRTADDAIWEQKCCDSQALVVVAGAPKGLLDEEPTLASFCEEVTATSVLSDGVRVVAAIDAEVKENVGATELATAQACVHPKPFPARRSKYFRWNELNDDGEVIVPNTGISTAPADPEGASDAPDLEDAEDFCAFTADFRKEHFLQVWEGVYPKYNLLDQTKHRGMVEVRAHLEYCLTSCTELTHVDAPEGTIARARYESCDAVVHWLPLSLGNTESTCHLAMTSSILLKEACFWGKCVHDTTLFKALRPTPTFQRSAESDVLPLYGDNNPNPLVEIVQSAMATECSGIVTMWIGSFAEFGAVQQMLRTLIGFNQRVTLLEVRVAPSAHREVQAGLSSLVDELRVLGCRRYHREHLTPVTLTRLDAVRLSN